MYKATLDHVYEHTASPHQSKMVWNIVKTVSRRTINGRHHTTADARQAGCSNASGLGVTVCLETLH